MHSLKPDDKIIKLILENGLNIYNVWFHEVEKECGLDQALNLSLNVWRKLAKIDGKKVSETFEISGKSLDEIIKLIDIIAYLLLMETKIEKIDEDSVKIEFTSCYWRSIISNRQKDGIKTINCNEIEINAFNSLLESINPEFEIITLKAYPLGDSTCQYIIRKKKK